MTSRQNVYTYPTDDDDYYDSTAGPQLEAGVTRAEWIRRAVQAAL